MTLMEKPLVIPCVGEEMIGILARTEGDSPVGIVIVVGGPQYRAGSHRHFVFLARTLAAAGYPVLRFDFRGMGDSSGERHSFEHVGEDIGAAIDALLREYPGMDRVVLCGLCDGASAALLYCHQARDPRVEGLVLVNPWVRSEATLARTQIKHYYGQRLLEREFWRKLRRGELAIGRSLLGLFGSLGRALGGWRGEAGNALSYQGRMAAAWRDFPGHIFLVLSGRDYVAKEFMEFAKSDPAWAGLLDKAEVRRALLPEADHTFSSPAARRQFESLVLRWLQQGWAVAVEEKKMLRVG